MPVNATLDLSRKIVMIKIIKIVAGIISCLLLVSCVNPIKNISDNYELNDKSGVILLSLTASGECGYSYFTEIRNITNRKTYSIGMQDFGSRRDWEKKSSNCPSKQDDYFGKLVAIEIPNGNYEIYQLEGITSNSRIHSNSEMSVKFTVRANKINYLGNMHYHMKKKRFVYGVKKKIERDIALFRKKYKHFKNEDIIINLLKMKKIKTLTAQK